jgi:hypothetical protein
MRPSRHGEGETMRRRQHDIRYHSMVSVDYYDALRCLACFLLFRIFFFVGWYLSYCLAFQCDVHSTWTWTIVLLLGGGGPPAATHWSNIIFGGRLPPTRLSVTTGVSGANILPSRRPRAPPTIYHYHYP